MKRTGKKVVLDISNYDFHSMGIDVLPYPLPDVSCIICTEQQVHHLLQKWDLSKLYVLTYDWELSRLDQVNLAVRYTVNRLTKFKETIEAGHLDKARSYLLYGLSNPLELSGYHMFKDSVVSLIKYVATGIAFEYALYNTKFSRSVGIWRKIPGLEDDIIEARDFKDDELGYEREETYILNTSILESIAKGLNHAKTVL